jgi:hypothetical protein
MNQNTDVQIVQKKAPIENTNQTVTLPNSVARRLLLYQMNQEQSLEGKVLTFNDDYGTPGTEANKEAARTHYAINNKNEPPKEIVNSDRSYNGKVVFNSKIEIGFFTAKHNLDSGQLVQDINNSKKTIGDTSLPPNSISLSGSTLNSPNISSLTKSKNPLTVIGLPSKSGAPGEGFDVSLVTNSLTKSLEYLRSMEKQSTVENIEELKKLVVNNPPLKTTITTTRGSTTEDKKDYRYRTYSTEINAQSLAVDSKDHKVFVAVPIKDANRFVPGVSGSPADITLPNGQKLQAVQSEAYTGSTISNEHLKNTNSYIKENGVNIEIKDPRLVDILDALAKNPELYSKIIESGLGGERVTKEVLEDIEKITNKEEKDRKSFLAFVEAATEFYKNYHIITVSPITKQDYRNLADATKVKIDSY